MSSEDKLERIVTMLERQNERLSSLETKSDAVKHDTGNVRTGLNYLPTLLSGRKEDGASNMAKLAMAGVITLIVGFVGGALTWGTVNLMQVGPMVAHVSNLQRSQERTADSIQQMRINITDLTGMGRRIDEMDKRWDETITSVRTIQANLDRRLQASEERDYQLERRIADLIMRRPSASSSEIVPEAPPTVLPSTQHARRE